MNIQMGLKKWAVRMLAAGLFHLYTYRPTRFLVLRAILRLEGGEPYSGTWRRVARYFHDVKIGMYSYGVCFAVVPVPPRTEIGRYCSIAGGLTILNGNHPFERKAMHPFFYNPQFKYVDEDMIPRSRLVVGNDVWVGYNVTVLPSVTSIGDGAVIGAGSVVTKNVPPFAVVAGNPARIIKYRFSEEKRRELVKEAWWNKDIGEIVESGLESFLRPLEPG